MAVIGEGRRDLRKAVGPNRLSDGPRVGGIGSIALGDPRSDWGPRPPASGSVGGDPSASVHDDGGAM